MILSIDIGSVTVSGVLVKPDGKVIDTFYSYHHGKPWKKIIELISEFELSDVKVVTTPSVTETLNSKVIEYNAHRSVIEAAKFFYGDLKALLHIGAAKYQLMHFNDQGEFSHAITSTSCAAGTGSFLDQQAKRLEMDTISELTDLADKNLDPIPEIASRCSVFAKTDLIHAQQAGYSLSAICDSLCRGLAKNIAETLFDDTTVPSKIIFTGGVAINRSVNRHLAEITGSEFEVHKYSHLFPAIGAALIYLKENDNAIPESSIDPSQVVIEHPISVKQFVFEPLSIRLSEYPDFDNGTGYYFIPVVSSHPGKVQVEIFADISGEHPVKCFMGLDIGSTSTKAIIIDRKGEPVAGFYTYTYGQPLNATRAILESLSDFGRKAKAKIEILSCATTGSGRKFIGFILGADKAIDEITTHAKAAVWLNPDTDTIIEIGGQDAKFTRLKNGNVTFSKMNSVCAAGTGSFIEEQALKLDVSIEEYSSIAEDSKSPLASDRCTVFMERDINYYLNQGYETGEVLAAVLHSVRDNYLKKVAVESSIGNNICFQGATARNKALVASFELKLGKKIYVSRFCHLTGALGSALILKDEFIGVTKFRGFELLKGEVKLKNETCGICNNSCRITVADIDGEKVAYGFLCGRDYKTDKFVEKNSSGFNLLKERAGVMKLPGRKANLSGITIGLPAALHIFEELGFWKLFFNELGYNVVSSENLDNPLEKGKRLSGAEFCAPMHALYGHISWLDEKVDYIFLPASLQKRSDDKPTSDLYCYYTQFGPAVVSLISSGIKSKCLVPLLHFEKGERYIIETLYRSMKKIDPDKITRKKVRNAYRSSKVYAERIEEQLKQLLAYNLKEDDELAVVLLGRPYLLLSKSLNSDIPNIFGSMGIKTFYQDMLPVDYGDSAELDELLRSLPWHFASTVLKAAEYIARSEKLFPVFVTAFKCAPDSFVIEYFQQLLDSYGKPYLILQTDEHDSSVGYETRIEAAIRSFRNHLANGRFSKDGKLPLKLPVRKLSKDKIVLFPNWDQIAGRFLVSNLRRYGFEAQLIDHTDLGIRKAMATNTGQCLPLNIIAQDYMDHIERHKLDPGKTVLWMTESRLSCNIRMYPQYISSILQKQANGFGEASVYSGELSHTEISPYLTIYAYFAYMLSGLLRRVGCSIRPYEINVGETDRVLAESIVLLEESFEGKRRMELSIREITARFGAIKRVPGKRPLVAIFGDFFVRDNDVMNQDLFHTIEKYGGEVLSTPYSEYCKLVFENVVRRRSLDTPGIKIMGYRSLLILMNSLERKYLRYFEKFIGKQNPVDAVKLETHLKKFNIDPFHSGESYDNILKIFHIIESYPGISLFVQTNPAFCCPSLITEAMKNEIRRQTGIPIVTITYDGTTESKNDVLAAYLS